MSEYRKGWQPPENPREEVQALIDSLKNGFDSLSGEILPEEMAKIKFKEIEYLMKEYENSPAVKKGCFGNRPFKEKKIVFIAGLNRITLMLKRIPTRFGCGKLVLATDQPKVLDKLLSDNTIAVEMIRNSDIWKKRQDRAERRKTKSAERARFLNEGKREEQRISDLFTEEFNNKVFLSYDGANEALKEIRQMVFNYNEKYGGGRMENDTLSRIEKKLARKSETERTAQVRFKIVEGKQRVSAAISLNRWQDGSLELWCADDNIIIR